MKLAFIGFGGVGQGLAEILLEKETELKSKWNLQTKVVAVSDVVKGSIYHPDGLDIRKLLNIVRETGNIEDYPDQEGLIKGLNSLDTIRSTNADTIIEVTFTDVKTGQPAIDHHKEAFKMGKHVVTTNKGPVALAYQELSELASKNNVQWRFEGSVMSGTPAIGMPLSLLSGNDIYEIKGIFNGTTNFILTKMGEGHSFEGALTEAQELGYAEADPTSDLEGYDVLYKILILSNVVMDYPLTIDGVERVGIANLTLTDIEQAKKRNKCWKLLARIKKENNTVSASVKPEMIDLNDPLAGITGATNAITFETDLLGTVTLSGAGAGRTETGFSLLIDLIHIKESELLNG